MIRNQPLTREQQENHSILLALRVSNALTATEITRRRLGLGTHMLDIARELRREALTKGG